MNGFVYTVLVLILILGPLIFVHELGHFLAAKWAGIRVHRFAIGMGNPIPGLSFRRGATEYAVCWLPIGGYVKMATREEEATSGAAGALEGAPVHEPVPDHEFFESKPVWKRMIVILAGVSMNVVFAWLIFSGLAAVNGEQLEPTTTVGRVLADSLPPDGRVLATLAPGDRIVRIGSDTVTSWNDVAQDLATAPMDSVPIALADGRVLILPIHHAALSDRLRASLALAPYRRPVLGDIVPGRPAQRAGLQTHDTVLAVNGDTVPQWYDLVDRIRASAGQSLTLRIARAGKRLELTVTPEPEQEPAPGGGTVEVGKIGAGPFLDVVTRPFGFFAALGAGAEATSASWIQIVRTVQGLVSARISSREVGGPILIGQMAAQAARLGVDTFLSFMALVSVNLAVLNLLPIPVLDGGQFLFLLAEGVLRRPLSLRLRERLTLVGLFLIACLLVLVFSNDIRRLFGV